ncbi:LmeA family phospholipid-binding protein [Streptomyces sp. NBC_00448]|uniref:LmeA family phospholipid-binding protein n=1 Tax=Streptomyces sp. NBC_00448 TaxID=2903652 RepID=UPI002E1DDBCA
MTPSDEPQVRRADAEDAPAGAEDGISGAPGAPGAPEAAIEPGSAPAASTAPDTGADTDAGDADRNPADRNPDPDPDPDATKLCEPAPALPRRRFGPRRKPLIVATAVVAGLALLASAADLVLAHTARERIARAAGCKLKPTGPVSADLSGSLAGLRLLTGDVGTVHIRAEDVRRDGLDLSVAADLHEVTTKGTMSGGTATATISYDELGKRLNRKGAGLRPESDGHGGLVLTGTLVGIPLPVTVHTSISTSKDAITVTPTDVDVLGRTLPVSQMTGGQGGSALAAKLAPRTVKAPELPPGVALTGARTDSHGLGLMLALPASVSSGASKGCAA